MITHYEFSSIVLKEQIETTEEDTISSQLDKLWDDKSSLVFFPSS